MKRTLPLVVIVASCLLWPVLRASLAESTFLRLAHAFVDNPALEARPHVHWPWLNGDIDTKTASLASLQQVKDRAIGYLLGGSGDGAYRQTALRDNDQWVQTVLVREFESLAWDERAALTMNRRLNARASAVLRLAIAFRSAGSRYEEREDVRQRITAGLANVLKHYNPATSRPGNWAQWLISLPRNLGATALLMESYLPPELLARLQTTLRHELTPDMILTGTNAAWEARNHIYLALLDGDLERLQRAAHYVFRTVRFGTTQGVREDYCYLFHGRLPYAGGYGAGFAQTIAELIYVFEGTPWAIAPVHRDLITNLLLEHTRWFIADGRIDLHVRGRSFKGGGGNWGEILEALLVLGQTDSPRSEEVAATAAAMLKAHPQVNLALSSTGFADRLIAVEGQMPYGFRYWPSGEIGVFRQPSFHVGFRQYSTRVQDYEYLAREDGGSGGDGWNLAYGFTNIIRGDGVRHMSPNFDVEHLPGTTSRIGGHPVNPHFERDPNIPTMSTTGFSLNFGTSPFAGGAGWEDGGVAGFILEPAYGAFTAKKSLHFFPEGFWALGSGITSTAQSADMAGKPIHTTILQWVSSRSEPALTLADGSFALVDGSTAAPGEVDWFWIEQEHVAVVFAERARIFVRLQDNIITVWLDHGSQPAADHYAYAVLPDTSLDEARRFAHELPVRPVRHDESVHAVREGTRRRDGIVFFEPDSGLGITSESPAIVYRKGDDRGGVLTIQDPLHETKEMKLTVEELAGEITQPDAAVRVTQSVSGSAHLEVSTTLGRVYRFGYGAAGQAAYGEPRIDLDLSSYHDFHVEATSDAEKTILTVHLPDEAVQEGYELSVHFSKSHKLHVFSDADVVDRPSPNTVRYRWYRKPAKGPSVFSDYLKQTHGDFRIYLVTPMIEAVESFSVPVT